MKDRPAWSGEQLLSRTLAEMQPPAPSELLRRRVLAMAPPRSAAAATAATARTATAAALAAALAVATLLHVTGAGQTVDPAGLAPLAFEDEETAPDALPLLGEPTEEFSVAATEDDDTTDTAFIAGLALD